jgi:hypothetical protein
MDSWMAAGAFVPGMNQSRHMLRKGLLGSVRSR